MSLLFYVSYVPSAYVPLNANPTKWSNTLKQFAGKLPTNCLSVFDHFGKLALKGLSVLYLTRLRAFIFYVSFVPLFFDVPYVPSFFEVSYVLHAFTFLGVSNF